MLIRDPDTKRCERGSRAEIWRDLAGITLAELKANGKILFKLSEIIPDAQELLTLCKVPRVEEFLSE